MLAPYDAETDGYEVAAFDEAITTTKATAIYNMHTDWSRNLTTRFASTYVITHVPAT